MVKIKPRVIKKTFSFYKLEATTNYSVRTASRQP